MTYFAVFDDRYRQLPPVAEIGKKIWFPNLAGLVAMAMPILPAAPAEAGVSPANFDTAHAGILILGQTASRLKIRKIVIFRKDEIG